MLRYRINHRNLKEGLRDISIIKTEMAPIPGKEGDSTNFVVCYCDNVDGIEENQKLMAIFDIDQYVLAEGQTQQYQMTEWVKVDTVDNVDCVFTIEIPRYMYLNITRMYISQKIVKDNGDIDEGDLILHIQFEGPHYMSDGYEESENNTSDTDDEETVNNKDRTFIIQHLDDTGFIIESEINLDDYDGRLVSNSALTLNFTKLKETDNEELKSLVTKLEDAIEYPTSAIIYNTTTYRGEIPLSIITAKRETLCFTERSGVSISVDKPSCAIEIPLGNTNIFGVGKDQEMRDIIDNQVKSAINSINDMEKDMYYPVYKDKDEFKPIYKIRFNLHFREHRGPKWLVDPSSYWNGTILSEDKVELMNDSSDEENGYFSYPDNKRSCQSDLIAYLNFTNNDIKYQKSKVKKSFIRLSCYDSTITTEQNLLSTSTVFVNAGELFTKQIRNMEETPYSSIIYSDDNKISEVKMGLVGAKVDREPYGALLDHLDENKLDEIEDLRLSSQFVVQDTNNSTASSEGFYQYFWKDYYNGSEPRPLYMRVEFNHAGYGITTPFMMPFWDKVKWKDNNKSGIKSFQEILDDWNDYPIKRDENGKITNSTDGPYGIKQYMKFMYLYFQYQYDEKTDKHVYYLDSNVYGEDTIEYNKNDGSLTINLYEAKISNDRETIE